MLTCLHRLDKLRGDQIDTSKPSIRARGLLHLVLTNVGPVGQAVLAAFKAAIATFQHCAQVSLSDCTRPIFTCPYWKCLPLILLIRESGFDDLVMDAMVEYVWSVLEPDLRGIISKLDNSCINEELRPCCQPEWVVRRKLRYACMH